MYETIDWATQHKLALRLQQAQKAARYYFVDIAGTCNLRCPSCAVGNMPALHKKGMMARDRFRSILDKIRSDNTGSDRIFVDLYNWGEPLLHPDIGGIIQDTREAGFGCGISSNLVFGKYLAKAVAAKPDYIRVSLSGYFNATYQQTHTGGDVNLVKANLYKLRHELERHENTQTVIQIGFHVYRTNFPDDFRKMLRLSDELGFLFSPAVANIMPIEKSVAVLEGQAVSGQDLDLLDRLIVHPKLWEELNLASGIDATNCQFKDRRTTINFDGSVALCCATYEPDKLIANDFLAAAEEDLVAARRNHPYCGTCMKHRLHHCYTGIRPDSFHEKVLEVLGEEYSAYKAASVHVGSRDHVVFDGQLTPYQEIYGQGMERLRYGDEPDQLRAAEKHFDALVEYAPWFAEGLFQAASVKKRLGDSGAARELAKAASEAHPVNPNYSALLDSL